MQSKRLTLRVLGAAHIAVAIILLPSTLFVGFVSVPVILPGLIWLAIPGNRLWSQKIQFRGVFRYTHIVLALFGVLLITMGLDAIGHAQQSAEAGGGLLSPVAYIPIMMGIPAGLLSIASLYVSYSRAFSNTPGRIEDRKRGRQD